MAQTSSELLGRITEVGGVPSIRDTGVLVESVMKLVDLGADIEEVSKQLPGLQREDVLASMLYTARRSKRFGALLA